MQDNEKKICEERKSKIYLSPTTHSWTGFSDILQRCFNLRVLTYLSEIPLTSCFVQEINSFLFYVVESYVIYCTYDGKPWLYLMYVVSFTTIIFRTDTK